MEIYVNLLGTWTLLDDEADNILGQPPLEMIEKLRNEEFRKENPIIDITHDHIRYVIPIDYFQIKNYY